MPCFSKASSKRDGDQLILSADVRSPSWSKITLPTSKSSWPEARKHAHCVGSLRLCRWGRRAAVSGGVSTPAWLPRARTWASRPERNYLQPHPLSTPLHSNRVCDGSSFALLSQTQRLPLALFLRPPIKWERKLESKHSASLMRTSVLRPPGKLASPWKSYFSQGRPSLKNLLVLFFLSSSPNCGCLSGCYLNYSCLWGEYNWTGNFSKTNFLVNASGWPALDQARKFLLYPSGWCANLGQGCQLGPKRQDSLSTAPKVWCWVLQDPGVFHHLKQKLQVLWVPLQVASLKTKLKQFSYFSPRT